MWRPGAKPSTPPEPEPLTRPELGRIWRWERHMIAFYAGAITLLALAMGAVVMFAEIVWLRRALLVMVLALVAAGSYVQFRERCPRCGRRLGTQSRLLLPTRCRGCRVKFDRPPPRGQTSA
jgi:hypothetical protein